MKGWFKRFSNRSEGRLIGDVIGGIGLFVLLWAGLLIGWGM